ncbi:uncharacterized protein I303_106925 [Kwoniella dejecticola CBS 10117]|uniref:Acetoacetate decarboxylase n=1 Tax=Kwoniella dejecticola CBS 10117 TaxID=1296121 RepID=A0A1A5ZTB1_9TREE|nr:uncharacterized protein I303_08436 [Kwoniella dejecticola CBS 10117]OBR81054.1 hypothetical protein I303_08436 [Kwoniella dejecticola CBS 10117]
MFENTKQFHRVPVGFGPAPSPRQAPNGKPFPNWKEDSYMQLTGVVLNVERAELQAILPEGYEIDPDVAQPTIVFELMGLRALPWLAGRGYNTWGVYANDVICRRVTPTIKASYLLVLFESFTDPITTGREELGFCKLWAEIPDAKLVDGNLLHTASWFGTEFLRLEIPQLSFKPIDQAPGFGVRPYTMPSVQGLLHHRYVPAVGDPGKHDASYATHMPGLGTNKPNIEKFATTLAPLSETKLTITSHPFESLPTLWTVVDGLAALKLGDIREVYHQIERGASDCSRNKRIEF